MIAIIASAIINLNTGFLSLTSDFFQDSAHSQIAEIHINRVLVMMLAGISIPTSGFLMQEYFQNPLAGPDILGITSVASLSVAFYIFFSHTISLPEFLQNSFLSLSAIVGSLLLMLVLLSMSNRFQDKSYLIIFGFWYLLLPELLFLCFSFMQKIRVLKNYILWSFGANNMVTRNQIYVLSVLVLIGMLICFRAIKPLIGNSLGNSYAQSLGVNLKQLKLLIIVCLLSYPLRSLHFRTYSVYWNHCATLLQTCL